MTYSIIARCPDTGRFGIGIATYSVAVGQWCHGVDDRAGVTMSQAFVRYVNNDLALSLLRQGFSAASVTRALLEDDDYPDYRQIGTVSRDGRASCHTGPGARGWAGHRLGDGYVAMGNVLSGEPVVQAMAVSFEDGAGQVLEARLLAALAAGRDAGGQSNGVHPLGERSAALIVSASDALPRTDLRVDLHQQAVDELARVYAFCNRYAHYYKARGLRPVDAPAQEAFEKSLA
ncbi:DUF1028 domain-containing protein [Chitinasiproducens palmae]|uniref:Uncharacterized conserved protein, Ntn-hydrolase superfamily n=1 Tax=Chitinasiproducens palmae TaxID=1770053 RepID=A0A1H2PK65_9BURK|nr:DUF1028 domain-containing protein [Chitinasiproducens palmae]SDV46838.1 Uncharacterized conserved protein, Ntn-hydrolase superfamily [Chitinasiproducens palmae]